MFRRIFADLSPFLGQSTGRAIAKTAQMANGWRDLERRWNVLAVLNPFHRDNRRVGKPNPSGRVQWSNTDQGSSFAPVSTKSVWPVAEVPFLSATGVLKA